MSVVAVLMAETRSPTAVLIASASIRDPLKAVMELSSDLTYLIVVFCIKAEAELTDLNGDSCDVCLDSSDGANAVLEVSDESGKEERF